MNQQTQDYFSKLYKDLKLVDQPFIKKEKLSEVEIHLIWQFFRFNREYREAFDQFNLQCKKTSDLEEMRDAQDSFTFRFLISEPEAYSNMIPSKEISFFPPQATMDLPDLRKVNPYISLPAIDALMKRWVSPKQTFINPIIIAINPLAPRPKIHLEIDSAIEAYLSEIEVRHREKITGWAARMRGKELSIDNLMTALICYYSCKIENTKTESYINNLIQNILQKKKSQLNSKAIKNRILAFHEIASISPHIFFYPKKR